MQSCRTHEPAVAKVVAAMLLADWRQQLLRLDSRSMPSILKLVRGSPVLSQLGWISLADAANLSGIGVNDLLRAAANGAVSLFCRLSWVPGVVMPIGELGLEREITSPSRHRVIQERPPAIPDRQDLPDCAYEDWANTITPLFHSREVAHEVLANGLKTASIRLFQHDETFVFVSDKPVVIAIEQFEVSTTEVNNLRDRFVRNISPEAREHAQEVQKATVQLSIVSVGKKAHKRYSEALNEYATTPSGIPGSVVSLTEQKQKHRGCSLFIELVGDLLLSEITVDRLREFREKLKTLPGKANNISKQYRRETAAATVQAMNDDGVKWPSMSGAAQHERMQWVDQMFRWLVTQDWLNENPLALVMNEQTKTAADRKTESQAKALLKASGEEDDSDNREPFTPSELRLIFNQPQYKTGNGVHVMGNGKWYPFEYWLPIMALHAGFRIKEVSQLHLRDIRQSSDGAWYFDLNETTSDKSLKNENATRQIPMSPMMIDLGLIEYRNKLESEGFQRLFPELTWYRSDAKYAKESKRKMSAMFEKLGMPRDSTKVFHCLRANFNDALLRVPFSMLPFDDPDLKKFIRLKIMGHKLEGVNEKHYLSTTMAEKSALVQGLCYDLPDIAPFDIDFGVAQVRLAINKKKGFRRGHEDMGPLNAN
jgi:integrase